MPVAYMYLGSII